MGAKRAVTGQPELSPTKASESGEQYVDAFSLDEASDEEIARLTRHEETGPLQRGVRCERGKGCDQRAVRVCTKSNGVTGVSRTASKTRIELAARDRAVPFHHDTTAQP